MTKCDFCTMSTPSGRCYWSDQSFREDYCEKAIERMVEALKASKEKKDGSQNNNRV